MSESRCIIIPAIKKNAVIPDQLVKKMAGVTLIQRALNTAKAVLQGKDIHVITDSEEISLICRRNGVNYRYDKAFKIRSSNILLDLKGHIEKLAVDYDHLLVYRASAPLVDHLDIENGYELLLKTNADIVVTLRKQEHCIWRKTNGSPEYLICSENIEPILIEIKSLLILKASAINGNPDQNRVVPYYLNEKAVEINGYQDWWICEKILQQKHIVFVVTGYAAIGMGHIFRALTLAHEIVDHRITFLCTRESELAVRQIAEKDYKTILQQRDLLEDVQKLKPDLVVNDILNTEVDYIDGLKQQGIKVVNFEDIGPGAYRADLVINAVYPPDENLPDRFLCGHRYFCLRDEFHGIRRKRFHDTPRNLLITFGGTDPKDFTLKTLCAVLDICQQRQMRIFIVTGSGYIHHQNLINHMATLAYRNFEYVHETGVMSSIMERVDLAICSAGRTIYELAHMKVPAIVVSQNEREHTHYFARPEYGFEYLGYKAAFDPEAMATALLRMLDPGFRRTMRNRMGQFHFEQNKNRVIKQIVGLLEEM